MLKFSRRFVLALPSPLARFNSEFYLCAILNQSTQAYDNRQRNTQNHHQHDNDNLQRDSSIAHHVCMYPPHKYIIIWQEEI